MSDKTTRADDEIGFSDAMSELERILRGVEAEETDIDMLGEELARAAELLELCRRKIRRAEVEVTQIVQSLQEDSPGGDQETNEDGPEANDNAESGAEEAGDGELPF